MTIRWRGSPIPLAVVGAAKGGDCAPVESNYKRFFNAAPAPKWVRQTKHMFVNVMDPEAQTYGWDPEVSWMQA